MNRERDIREMYFDWLYRLVSGQDRSYLMVCTKMHQIKFNYEVPNDDNRAKGGLELRNEFIATFPSINLSDYMRMHSLGRASVFEVLVALAHKADFQAELGPGKWFTIFLRNLGLLRFVDGSGGNPAEIDRIITRFNNRTYSPSGKGGIFPLKNPAGDQRNVELWFQMSAYIIENKMI